MLVRWIALVVGLCVTTPAVAGKADNALIVHRVTGEEVAALLLEAGQLPRLEVDRVGDPMIRSDLEGRPYVVLFYECEGDRGCAAFQFRAWVGDGPADGAARVADWNRTRRLGRAYVDRDGDPTLEHNVRLHGGVTPEHLRHERDWFLHGLVAFDLALSAPTGP